MDIIDVAYIRSKATDSRVQQGGQFTDDDISDAMVDALAFFNLMTNLNFTLSDEPVGTEETLPLSAWRAYAKYVQKILVEEWEPPHMKNASAFSNEGGSYELQTANKWHPTNDADIDVVLLRLRELHMPRMAGIDQSTGEAGTS